MQGSLMFPLLIVCVYILAAVTDAQAMSSHCDPSGHAVTNNSGVIHLDVNRDTPLQHTQCIWNLRPAAGMALYFTFDFLFLGQSGGCRHGNLTLVDWTHYTARRFCQGSDVTAQPFYIPTIQVDVIFRVSQSLRQNGFSLRFQAVACPALEIPRGVGVKLDANRVTISCGGAGEPSSVYHCRSNRWRPQPPDPLCPSSELSVPVLTLSLVGVSAVIILITIIVCAVCVTKRYNRRIQFDKDDISAIHTRFENHRQSRNSDILEDGGSRSKRVTIDPRGTYPHNIPIVGVKPHTRNPCLQEYYIDHPSEDLKQNKYVCIVFQENPAERQQGRNRYTPLCFTPMADPPVTYAKVLKKSTRKCSDEKGDNIYTDTPRRGEVTYAVLASSFENVNGSGRCRGNGNNEHVPPGMSTQRVRLLGDSHLTLYGGGLEGNESNVKPRDAHWRCPPVNIEDVSGVYETFKSVHNRRHSANRSGINTVASSPHGTSLEEFRENNNAYVVDTLRRKKRRQRPVVDFSTSPAYKAPRSTNPRAEPVSNNSSMINTTRVRHRRNKSEPTFDFLTSEKTLQARHTNVIIRDPRFPDADVSNANHYGVDDSDITHVKTLYNEDGSVIGDSVRAQRMANECSVSSASSGSEVSEPPLPPPPAQCVDGYSDHPLPPPPAPAPSHRQLARPRSERAEPISTTAQGASTGTNQTRSNAAVREGHICPPPPRPSMSVDSEMRCLQQRQLVMDQNLARHIGIGDETGDTSLVCRSCPDVTHSKLYL